MELSTGGRQRITRMARRRDYKLSLVIRSPGATNPVADRVEIPISAGASGHGTRSPFNITRTIGWCAV